MSAAALRAWLLVVAWAALIFAFSSIPGLGTGLGTWDLVLRKLAHLTEFAILGALLARALARTSGRPWGLAVLLGALYAVSDEVHQHFVPDRRAAWYDVLIDTAGVVIGVVAAWRWSRRARAVEARPDPTT